MSQSSQIEDERRSISFWLPPLGFEERDGIDDLPHAEQEGEAKIDRGGWRIEISSARVAMSGTEWTTDS